VDLDLGSEGLDLELAVSVAEERDHNFQRQIPMSRYCTQKQQIHRDPIHHYLGSRLIDYSQNVTIAAMAMMDRNVCA
jgi:hypothetical protein